MEPAVAPDNNEGAVVISPEDEAELEEHAALRVMQRWDEMREFVPGALPLVPEHIETRSLWNHDRPGLPPVQ